MGICISSASSQIRHETNGVGSIFEEDYKSYSVCGIQKLESICSKQGSKGLNQDAAFSYQEFGGVEESDLVGVFDGHGQNGHIVSNIVKNRLPSLLLGQITAKSSLMQSKSFDKWKEAFETSFKVMDKEIKLQENLDCSCSGSTAVVLVKQGDNLVIGNLGDSRAVMGRMRDDGIEAVQLTTDLKPGLASEGERIRSCKGRVLALKEEAHIQRVWLPNEDAPGLAMSRAFGDFALKDYGIIAIPDVSFRRLTSHDRFIVLATDGIWDVLSNDQVASIVWAAESEEAAAKAVVEAAAEAWKRYPSSKHDDCTAVCHFLQTHNATE
ncbi:probable protein phosphatase 2C 72 [Benincasa hispida]|uniref:probable protein phosphatase 2C 72 n=1 Tax=Benincasa hispida TaxID=102211 RepID=UPI0019011B9C|nr:probable protein phosphatase 2C 72 [Benincasa hispida]